MYSEAFACRRLARGASLFMAMASGMFRRRDVAQSWIAGATSRRASSRARTTSCNMRVRRFAFKTVGFVLSE